MVFAAPEVLSSVVGCELFEGSNAASALLTIYNGLRAGRVSSGSSFSAIVCARSRYPIAVG